MENSKIVILTNDNFEQEVLNYNGSVMVEFWAPWCNPCKSLSPVIDELSDEFDGKVKICTVNVDENGEIASGFRVMSVPTMLFFKNGEQLRRESGPKSKEELTEYLSDL